MVCSDHLKAAGSPIPDKEFAFAMLMGLPDDYDHIMSQFIGLDDHRLTSINMQELLTVERPKKGNSHGGSGRRDHGKRGGGSKVSLLLHTASQADDRWVLDSGCTNHVCYNKDWFNKMVTKDINELQIARMDCICCNTNQLRTFPYWTLNLQV
ncbi:hypothetical protein CHUAL_011986 [Chamberlinius hualienensis]